MITITWDLVGIEGDAASRVSTGGCGLVRSSSRALRLSYGLGCLEYLSLLAHLFEEDVERDLRLLAEEVQEGVFGFDRCSG